MSTASPHPLHAVTGGACVLCGGPCRTPFLLPPIAASYPFLPRDVIEATWGDEHGPPLDERAHRRRSNRAHRLAEDRAHRLEDDR